MLLVPKRVRIVVIAAIAVVVLVVAGLVWWITSDDSPSEVSLEAAVAQVQARANEEDADATGSASDTAGADEPSESDPGASTGEAATDSGTAGEGEGDDGEGEAQSGGAETGGGETAATDDTATTSSDGASIAGTWTVDTTIGDFDYEQATGSFAGFRVDEELTLGEVTAVGRTGEVTGSVELTEDTLVAAEVIVDMTTITTDRSPRDGPTRRALRTGEHPEATFTLTDPVALPPGAAQGEPVSVEAVGNLTVAGVTNQAVFNLEAQLAGEVVVVVGSTEVTFADYGVQAPSAPIVVSVEDHGIVEFQLLLTR